MNKKILTTAILTANFLSVHAQDTYKGSIGKRLAHVNNKKIHHPNGSDTQGPIK